MSKAFHLGAILSITHDRLVAPRLMDDIYEICNFLTNDNLYTHQLPRVHDECKAWLLHLHPQLNEIQPVRDADLAILGHQWWKPWLAKQVAVYGEYLDVEPIPEGIHEYRDPIAEACEMVGRERVIVVDPSKTED